MEGNVQISEWDCFLESDAWVQVSHVSEAFLIYLAYLIVGSSTFDGSFDGYTLLKRT